ncbi:hypothetical protein [Pontibacter cellulosilyticus]|uniref:Uncharacterized protein n=1 Tax=Pontibacter cellulosilyticus TaxID=1720253 RepID=A0A923SI08_9BACT|nr:hypothetical protein [Pontibacter cellulosilyticus]MBC5992107.1 hypothetical protein [Pontibacter cellulosilyticus]
MSVSLKKDSIIYVACPADFVTGGPEAMHQLIHKLRSMGYNAFMYYFPADHKSPVPERFKEYNISFKREIIDDENNILICPEITTKLFGSYKHIRKAIWWLSIDNYFVVLNDESKLSKIKSLVTGNYFFKFDDDNANEIFHFAQSEYAFQFLKAKGLKKIYPLSDYLNKSYLNNTATKEKLNQVLYNPKKGIEKTKILINSYPEISWVPLEKMTLDQVKDTLSKSKVYIDFGNHPGKDRLPREAAMNNCCVITGREGSANYTKDLPIPEEFKFENVASNKETIRDLILDCFNDFEEISKSFANYRQQIINEEQTFEEEIQNLFIVE